MAETMTALVPLPAPGLELSMDSRMYHSATIRSQSVTACLSTTIHLLLLLQPFYGPWALSGTSQVSPVPES